MAKTKVHGEFLKDSVVRFTAKAGENITKGQAVYISGISGEVPVVSLADANDTAKMPAFGLAEATVSTNAEVEITSFGTLKGLDTSSYSLGDILYVDTTAGALTNNPSGLEATKLQNIGMVQRVHATSGSIKVGGAGRTNAVPNLDDGDIFIGDSNNKAISSSFTAVLNSEAGINSSADATAITIDSSENVGIGTTPASELHVKSSGTSSDTLTIENSTGNGSWKVKEGSSSNALLQGYNASNSETIRLDPTSDTFFNGGNVGIGTDSPARKLEVNTGSEGYVARFKGATSAVDIFAGNTGSFTGGLITTPTNIPLGFSTNTGTGSLIIDTSGNVLVGKTSTAFGTAGVQASASNGLWSTRSSLPPLALNRLSSDGSIVDFYKDGTTVGSIGTEGGDLVLGTGTNCGIQFNDGNNAIRPFNMASNAAVDNAVDLGVSGTRFKDLYLSGNVKVDAGQGILFGGAAGASGMTSQVLDDYEEGTWTPACGATLSTAIGHYTKIGNQVTVHYHLVTTGGLPTSTAQVIITGLPFTSNSGSLTAAPIYARYYTPNDSTLTSLVQDSETQIRLINTNDQNFDYTIWGELEASANNSVFIIGSATYIV